MVSILEKKDVQKPLLNIKKPNPNQKGDLDDFIFRDENAKIHSEK